MWVFNFYEFCTFSHYHVHVHSRLKIIFKSRFSSTLRVIKQIFSYDLNYKLSLWAVARCLYSELQFGSLSSQAVFTSEQGWFFSFSIISSISRKRCGTLTTNSMSMCWQFKKQNLAFYFFDLCPTHDGSCPSLCAVASQKWLNRKTFHVRNETSDFQVIRHQSRSLACNDANNKIAGDLQNPKLCYMVCFLQVTCFFDSFTDL